MVRGHIAARAASLLFLVPFLSAPRPDDPTQTVTAPEAEALVQYHNKVRDEVGVGPVKWSPTLDKFAQAWADEVARTGKIQHRPGDGEFAQKYGENIAWGIGDGFDVQTAARLWYEEKKSYTPGTPIPKDFGDFKAGHYTQMTWKDSTEIGAGKAVIQTGDQKGTLFVVCNYNPRGNMIGESPFPATGIGRRRDARNDDPEVAKLQAKIGRLEKENAELREAEQARLGADTRILNHLARAMHERPDDRGLRSEAADLAKRLAPHCQGNRTVWQVLMETGTLEGITTVEQAETLLGPATDKTDKRIGWYFNPLNRQVAPYLGAKITDGGLAEWKLFNR